MTLLEYRKSIYEAEFNGESLSLSDFLEDLKLIHIRQNPKSINALRSKKYQ